MPGSTKYQRSVQLVENVTAANSAPASNSSGIAISLLRDENGEIPEFATIAIKGSGTGGTVSAVFRLWFHFPGIGMMWAPAGNGTDADKGKLNEGIAVGEVKTDTILHAELIRLPSHADRVYLEVQSITGTGTSIQAVLIAEK